MKYRNILTITLMCVVLSIPVTAQTIYRSIISGNDFITQLNKQTVVIIKEKNIRYPQIGDPYSENDSRMIHINLWDMPPIDFYTYKYILPYYSKYHDEYLKIGDREIKLDSLLRSSSYQKTFEACPYMRAVKVSLVKFNDASFIVVTMESKIPYISGTKINSFVVVELDDELNVGKYHLLYNGYYNGSLSVFGDFNSDGKLDYLSWGAAQDTIRLYNYTDSGFVLDTNHYMLVEMTRSAKEYFKQYGYDTSQHERLDITNSKWFFRLDTLKYLGR